MYVTRLLRRIFLKGILQCGMALTKGVKHIFHRNQKTSCNDFHVKKIKEFVNYCELFRIHKAGSIERKKNHLQRWNILLVSKQNFEMG